MNNTPTLLIFYNRPDKTRLLLTELEKIKPKKLYIFCDGPKNNEDLKKIKVIKKLIQSITWTTPTLRFENENLGCKKGVSSAITWFFSNEKAGVILEDDCLPNE